MFSAGDEMTDSKIEAMEPNILLSFINTKLRDEYDSLEGLCYDLELTQVLIEDKLLIIGYRYDKVQNQFKYFYA
jgi:hypothetical protein